MLAELETIQDIDMPAWQIEETARCVDNPAYFVETFGWLEQKASAGVSETNSIIPFQIGSVEPTKLQIQNRDVPDEAQFWFQRWILECLVARHNIVCLKSRRVGCSWIAALYSAWLINFFVGVKVVFISRNETEAIKLLDKVKFILNNLAYHDSDDLDRATKCPWLKGEVYSETLTHLKIGYRNEFGEITRFSVVESLTTTDDSARGDDATFIVFDELAFYDHPDLTWGSATKALTRGGHWMAISTPDGVGDIFHRLCARAELAAMGSLDEPLEYEFRRIHWSEAGITEEMKKKASIGDTQDIIDQEWEFKFIVPGTAVFNPTHLAACYKPLNENPDIVHKLDIFRAMVEQGHGKYQYFSGADTIKGNITKKRTEKDFNSFTAMTIDGIQAHHYYDQAEIGSWAGQNVMGPGGSRVEIPGKLSKLHEEFPGQLLIEEDGPGLTAWTNHILPKDHFSEKDSVNTRAEFKKGVIERLVIKVENHQIVITDPFTYQCMMVFQRGAQPGTYGAPPNYFDDPVISIALAEEMRDRHSHMHFSWGNALTSAPAGQYSVPQQEAEKLPRGPQILTENMRSPYSREVEDLIRKVPGPDMVDPDLTGYLERQYARIMGDQNGNVPKTGMRKSPKNW